MKKALSLILLLAVLVTQFVFVIPTLASGTNPDLVATFSTKAYCNGSKGYNLEAVTVSDNENFTSAVNTTVDNLQVYESSGMAPAIYNTSNSEKIVDWLSNDDAHLRFWIKIPFNLTVTIRLQHSTGYPSITTSKSFTGDNNWQEIRIKRSEFSKNATFDSTCANGGTINFQFLTVAGALEENATFSLSPLEFYDGELAENTPDDDTSSDDSTEESSLIAKYTEMSYFSESAKGYKLNSVAVEDNEKINSAIDFTVTNGELFNSTTTRDPAIYKADNTVLNIEKWATNPEAEMRFFIKITKSASFRVRLMHYNTAYNNVYKDIDFTASNDWQEIILKRSDFSANASFDEAVKNGGSVNLQFIINQNTFVESDSVLISPIEFYSGAVVNDSESGDTSSDGTSSDNTSSDNTSSDNTSSDDTSSDNTSSDETDDGETVLLTKYTEMSYNSGTKGYTLAGNAVADNKNFTSAIKFAVSDADVFNSLASRDPAIYKADNAIQKIKKWATDPDADMRFWVKVSKDVTLRLRLVHYLTAYSNIYTDVTLTAGDKWQEVRIKRSEFSENSAFDSAVAGDGSVNFQFIIEKDVMAQDDAITISPIEFYSGAIETPVDPDGGTIDLTPKEGNKITEYSTKGYNTIDKGYLVTEEAVADNSNFTSAISLEITDETLYHGRGGDAAIYGESSVEKDITAWAVTPYAQMRFWVKVPHAVTFTLRLTHSLNNVYTKVAYKLTVPASDKWQEIRIAREDFTGDSTFNEIIAKGGTLNIQILTDKNATDFMSQGENLLISPVSFYDGYIKEKIDPDGGTIIIKPKAGKKVAEYNTIAWNSDGKGYSVTEEAVVDNKNFTSAVALKITDEKVYHDRGGDAAMYSASVKDVNISAFAKTPYAQMCFWVKVPHQVTFTLRLIHSLDGVYTKVTHKITVPASKKWQEIRIAREDFSGDAAFNNVILNGGTVNIQILTDKNATDFMSQGEKLLMSPVSFYDGYIKEKIDSDGGTIVIKPKAGKEIGRYNTVGWNADGKGYSVTQAAVEDNSNFTSAAVLTVTDFKLYNSRGGDAAMYSASVKDVNIKDWANKSYAEMRFWVKVPHKVTFTLRLIHSLDGVYTKVTHKITIPASKKWQEIRIAREDFSGDAAFNKAVTKGGTVNIQILTDKNATDFLKQNEKLFMSYVGFFDGYIAADSDPNGGTIVITPKKGKEIASYSSIGWNADGKGYKVSEIAVDDNTNFKKGAKLEITDFKLYNSRGGDAAMYSASVKDVNIKNWANKSYAEMRFWVKVPHKVTFTLRLIHSLDGVYTKVAYNITVPASDKWQEIRIKRSDFTGDVAFNDAVKKGGNINIQILTEKNTTEFLKQNESLFMSPVSFYDGYIGGNIDKNGGTLVITPTKGKVIATYNTMGWNADGKGYKVSESAIVDNKNFTSAVALQIIDEKVYSARGGDAAMYSASVKDVNIKNWANKSYSEMRFWVKVPHEVTFTLRLIHSLDGVYTKVAYNINVPASDKWQEIRIKRSDFSGDFAFNDAVKKDGMINIQILTEKNATDFLKQDEKLLMSPVSFYDGYIGGKIDKNGGTIVITPKRGKKIAEYTVSGWNSTDKGYAVTDISVDDNKNFKIGRKITVTDEKLYLSQNRDPALFKGDNLTESISQWTKMPYNEMRFWVKVPHEVTFTVRLMNNSDGTYTGISTDLTIPASDKWQEIRLKREDFSGSKDFNSAVSKKGNVHLQILTNKNTTTFLSQDESLSISPIQFFDGYIGGKIDPTGGTVKVPDIYGSLINSIPAKVVKDIDGTKLQLVSVYDSDFVSKALKFTLTDEDVFYKQITQVNTNGADKPLDLADWNKYSKAEIRFWVKVPRNMKFKLQIVEHNDTQYPYIETTVEIDYKDGWQQIVIPRSAFSSRTDFTGEYIQYIRLLPIDNSGEGYLKFCDSLYISQVEFFDGIIPTSANKVNKGKDGKVINNIKLFPYVGNGSIPERIEVKDNSNFKSAVSTKIGEVRTFSSGEGAHVVHNNTETDLSDWHNNPNAQLRFWVRSAKDVVLQMGLQNPGSDKPSSYRAIWAQISIKGSEKWQEIRLSTKHFSETENFDPSIIRYIKIKGTGDDAITTNEVFFISDIEVYDGVITKAVSENGGTTKDYSENAIIATFSDFADNRIVSGKGIKATLKEVDTNKYFTGSLVLSGKGSYNVNLKTYYDTYDISRGNKGTLRLWVKTDSKNKFNIVLTDKNGKILKLPFSADGTGKWQELRAELKSVKASGFNYKGLFSVAIEGTLNSSLQLGKAELWKTTLATSIEEDGGEVEPPLELPPSWNSLTTMPADEENKILVNTSNSDFWIGDWNNTDRERSILAYNRGLDKKDINYYRFKIYKEISVVNADVYYKNPTPAMFYLRKVTDISPYLKTGTLRFWINVPKDMTITVTLQSIDENNKYSFATVELDLKKTEENNGFSEVQISLKDFYDAAVAAKSQWNPYCVKNILIGGVQGCNARTFLNEGELLCVSHFEIWKAAALEPEPFDPTRVFYSLHGDIFVKDINDVLAKTASLSAYTDTLNKEKYSGVSKRYFDNTELLIAYTIQLISAGQYDYNVVTAYDEVSVYIPIPDGIDTDNLKIAIHNREGIHECEFKVEDGYLVISTKQFGEFLLLKGGTRNDIPFDYNYDMSEYFGLVTLENAVTVPEKNGFNWLGVIIAFAVIIVCAGVTTVILILNKKGIVFRKGKVKK